MTQRQEKNPRFEQFWAIYPRHEVKMTARRAFERINPNDKTLYEMLQWIMQAKYSAQWQDTRFIPHPATWLNQRRWEDDIPPIKSADTVGLAVEEEDRDPETESLVQRAIARMKYKTV